MAREAQAVPQQKPSGPKVPPRLGWKWPLVYACSVFCLAIVANGLYGWWTQPTKADVAAGEQLFTHVWETNDPLSAAGDGLGPVFNAKSCVECHFQGGTGGGGGLKHNVAAFEVLPTVGHPEPTGGVVHAFATHTAWTESTDTVRSVFPIVPKGITITAVCQQPLREDYDPLRYHSINTPTLFGAGAIDAIPEVVIRTNHTGRVLSGVQKELNLNFNKAGSGRLRILPDGRVGKFGWKAQFATLEEFVANACAVEVGLTTPTRKQHKPKHHAEDPDARMDLDRRQFTQLVAYVSHLPAPQVVLPEDTAERDTIRRGQELFTSIGCADCHTPDLGDAQGIYSDLCLHDLTDHRSNGYVETPDVPVPEDYPHQSEWKTPPLWGVGQTAPYLHDGSARTLSEAIHFHAGEARDVRENFKNLPADDQRAVLRFLESLAVK